MKANKQKLPQAAINTLINELENSKKLKTSEEMKSSINKINLIAQSIQLSTIQAFIITFYAYYNHTTDKNETNEKIIQLSSFMIKNFEKENNISLIRNEISKNFPDMEIIQSENEIDDLRMCYSLCTLSKNIEMIDILFSNYLNVKIFDSNEYTSIDLENPIAFKLFESILQKYTQK